MNPITVIVVITCYFTLLLFISFFTGRNADTQTFFTANRQSPWYLVAFGMVGASLSGITFISVPGEVGVPIPGEGMLKGFSYFQMVLGYLLGYLVIGTILLPLYYRLNLISIYTYLEKRFGFWSYKTGAAFFLLSRTIGAAFRLFLVAIVLQEFLFDTWDIPFSVSVMVTIGLIWLYTFRGGIKTIVWTDTFQTLFMLLAVGVSIYLIGEELDLSFKQMASRIQESPYSQIFIWETDSSRNFFKQFFSGAFIAIVMTGLDQDMMQKNLTCRNIGEAQKNMFWFSIVLVFVNLLFLSLGALLYIFAQEKGIVLPGQSDQLFPQLANQHFPTIAGIVFLLGITAAAYSSADSALTSLTTSFCVDFLRPKGKDKVNVSKKTRIKVHLGFSVLLFAVVLAFKLINKDSIISELFKAAGYTYGPLLGLFAFGLFNKRRLKDRWVPLICMLSPAISYLLNANADSWLNGFKFGFMILLVNGLLTYLGLWMISGKKEPETI